MKEAPSDKVEEAIVNDRIVDSLRVLTMSEHGLCANLERISHVTSRCTLQAVEEREGRKEVRRLREKSGRQLLGREVRKKKENKSVIGEKRWAHKKVKKEKETRKGERKRKKGRANRSRRT